jgi:hypothetical protein
LPDRRERGEQSFFRTGHLVVQTKGGTQLEVLTLRTPGRAEEAMLFDSSLEIMLCKNNTDSGVRIFRRFIWISVKSKKLAS